MNKNSISSSEMRFLNLSSEDRRYEKNIEDNQLIWETPFLNLNSFNDFSILSLSVFTGKIVRDERVVTFKTNLMDANYDNPHGIVCTVPQKLKTVNFVSGNLAFWRVDNTRPRNIVLEIDGLDVKDVKSVNIVICFR